ncbi:MAG: transposase [Acidobacteria bacterium]|nr:transposase [Acidobacteriota bacterium]
MSNSPWSSQALLQQVRQEISQLEEFHQGGMGWLDESADEQASDKTVGADKHHNDRLGKVETSQVGTFLAYVNQEMWTWVDGELFLPVAWFGTKKENLCKKLGVPEGREFATKIELGLQMIERAKAEGLPFEAVGCDTLYGRSIWLRRQMATQDIVYMADVPADTRVSLRCPQVGVPESKPGSKPFTKVRVLSADKAVEVRALIQSWAFQAIQVRAVGRGFLEDEFATLWVWTATHQYSPQEETLLVRRDAGGKLYYGLSNAAQETSLEKLAWMKCSRHFIERSNQEAKSELGGDELRAQNYLAWEHHLALTVLASWFIAQTQHQGQGDHLRDESLKEEFEMEKLPRLSMANVRERWRATMPLSQLTPEEATNLVVRHLVNRARSRKSRIKHRHD